MLFGFPAQTSSGHVAAIYSCGWSKLTISITQNVSVMRSEKGPVKINLASFLSGISFSRRQHWELDEMWKNNCTLGRFFPLCTMKRVFGGYNVSEQLQYVVYLLKACSEYDSNWYTYLKSWEYIKQSSLTHAAFVEKWSLEHLFLD